MDDQQLKNIVAFLAWAETSGGLKTKSPEVLKAHFVSLLNSNSDVMARLDLNSLNLYIEWLKQWRTDLAPKGGAVPPEHLTGGQL